MDQKEKDCSYWVAILLVGLVLGVIAGLAIAGFAYPIYQSDKWAAWVQAFGSIGAILIAIQISRFETQRQKLNLINEAKIKLILKSEGIYEIYESLRKASEAASNFAFLQASQKSVNPRLLSHHMDIAGESLGQALGLAEKLDWELFLVAMPEKIKDIRLVLSGFSYLRRQAHLKLLVDNEEERDRIHLLLASYESLLKNEEFITLRDK